MTTYAGTPVFPQYFVNSAGRPQRSVSITIYDRGTTVKADLFADREKADPLANPFNASSFGNAEFFVDPGEYDALVNGVRIPFTSVMDPAEPVSEAAVEAVVVGLDLVDETALNAGLATKAPATGIAQSAVSGLVSALAGKEPSIAPGTYAEPPVVGDAVFYVASDGDDDGNNGLSWGKAKATAEAALTAGARKLIFGKGVFDVSALVASLRNVVLDGVGQGETILDFPDLSGSGIALDLSAGGPGGVRGSTVQNLTLRGPGDVTTTGVNTTGIKPYSGFSPRNVEIIDFGVGVDLNDRVGVNLDRSVEIRGCNLGWRTAVDGNKNHVDARVLGCVNGCEIDSNQVVLQGWFENCTGTEIKIKDANAVHMRDLWIEHTRTTPCIVLTPDSATYAAPLVVTLKDSFVTQAGGTHFMAVTQALALTVENVRVNDESYAAIQVDNWLMGLEDRGCYVAASDGETDRAVRVPLRVLGPGKVYSVSMPDDLANRPFSRSDLRPWIGGFADAASTNLVSDSSFETALNATGNGASAPTVTDDADAFWGTHSCKAVFAAAAAGTGGYLRLDKNIAATSGNWYVIQFMAKANKAFRGITFRMFNVTSGSFETLALPFIDLGTGYRRHRILWQAPATANFRLSWYKTVATSNDISLWVDDVAVWAGSVPGVYVPSRTAAVAKGAVAADTLVAVGAADIGGTLQAKRVKGGTGATALVAGDFALSAGWGDTATVTTISATDQGGTFTVAATGTGQGANPTVSITFKDGAWPVAPKAIVTRNGGNNGTVFPTWTTTTTQLVITFPGTPTASGQILFAFVVI